LPEPEYPLIPIMQAGVIKALKIILGYETKACKGDSHCRIMESSTELLQTLKNT
jgi:hypothetical protein